MVICWVEINIGVFDGRIVIGCCWEIVFRDGIVGVSRFVSVI